LTVGELCNRFLTSKKLLLDAGELSPRTWRDYHDTCERPVESFGKTRLVDDLAVDDFERFRVRLAEKLGPVALGNEIQRIRTIFKFAFDEILVDRPIRFGASFKKPNRKSARRAGNERGSQMIEADELRRIIRAAEQPLKAIILLGINCGFGQSDDQVQKRRLARRFPEIHGAIQLRHTYAPLILVESRLLAGLPFEDARRRTWQVVTGVSAAFLALGVGCIVYAATTAAGKISEEGPFWAGLGDSIAATCCTGFGLIELLKSRNPGNKEHS
jgi:hypothetical protein